MPRIAISYRRQDSAAITGRIIDRLTAQYGSDSVFRDIEDIPLGVDFREHIDTMLAESNIALVIIGKRWFGTARGRKRINDPADPVRVEVETALRRRMPVIPIFVEGSGMPKADELPDSLRNLIYRNGLNVDSGRDFDQHIARLIRNIDPIIAEAARQAEEEKQRAEAARLVEEERQRAEAARLVEEERQRAEAARLVEEERQRAEAARLVEEERQRAEAARLVEEERQRAEAARLVEEERQRAEAARSAEGAKQGAEATPLAEDVTTATFMTEVVDGSFEAPVIVNFWAPWCGPCKQLGPILEKTVRATNGAVRIVKLNIDEYPKIAQQMRIQSIPAVYAFKDGRPVDGFVGALTESQVKQFVQRLSSGKGPSPVEEALTMAKQALQSGDLKSAGALYSQILQGDPANVEALAGNVRAMIARGDLAKARQALDRVPKETSTHAEITAARSAFDLVEQEKQRAEEARHTKEEKQRVEAARQAEEERRRADAARQAEEEKRQAGATRQAEEEKRQAGATRQAEEEKRQAEAARQAEEKRQARAARQAEEGKRRAEEEKQWTKAERRALRLLGRQLRWHQRRWSGIGVAITLLPLLFVPLTYPSKDPDVRAAIIYGPVVLASLASATFLAVISGRRWPALVLVLVNTVLFLSFALVTILGCLLFPYQQL
jgi:thioredoxin